MNQEKLTNHDIMDNKVSILNSKSKTWMHFKPLAEPQLIQQLKPKRKLNWVLIKNHYSKTLRKERKKVDVFFKLNYRYQHRLTNWLFYFSWLKATN